MAYGSSLGITLPTVGTTAGPAWATSLNTALTTIISTLEAKVTPSGMDINADLSFRSGATSYMATDVKALEFTNQTSLLAAGTYPTTAFSYGSTTGELYWNDNAGNQVQLTDAGTVNVSVSGAITGAGYGSGGVAVNWDSGTSTYQMYLNSATPTYGSVLCDDLILNDGDTNTLTMAAPAMSANYTLTLPAAVPAANGTLLQMATTGTVTAANTGLDDVTLAADQHVTISGTGRFKHGALQKMIPASAGHGSANAFPVDTNGAVTNPTVTELWYIPITLDVGERITDITVYGSGGNASSKAFTLKRINASGADSDAATWNTSTSGVFSSSSGALTITIAAGDMYAVECNPVHASDLWYSIQVTYDRP